MFFIYCYVLVRLKLVGMIGKTMIATLGEYHTIEIRSWYT
jgi:hypothetical protein